MLTAIEIAKFPLIVNLILEDNGKVLLLYRKNTLTYKNHYALPAGKVEAGQSLVSNIIREAKEEIGIGFNLNQPDLVLTLWAKYAHEGKVIEDVSFFFKGRNYEGEIINAEPHKHDHLRWFPLDALPNNIIPMTRVGLEAYAQGKTYAEYIE